jgi:hypothetical protein
MRIPSVEVLICGTLGRFWRQVNERPAVAYVLNRQLVKNSLSLKTSRGVGFWPPISTRRVQFFPERTWETQWLDGADTPSNSLLTAMLLAHHQFWFCGCKCQGSSLFTFLPTGSLSMTFSLLHRWKEPTTRCSICGWSVTLELSKTDESGKAVHEPCYVRRTLSKLREQIDELPQSWAVTPIDPVRAASESALAGIYWRVFGLIRL